MINKNTVIFARILSQGNKYKYFSKSKTIKHYDKHHDEDKQIFYIQ